MLQSSTKYDRIVTLGMFCAANSAMIQILYEHTAEWPNEKAFILDAPPLHAEIRVSPESARRRANSFLTLNVAMEFSPGDPVLIYGERLLWRMPVHLLIPGIGAVSTVGAIEVDAITREVVSLSTQQIAQMRKRAHDIAERFTPAATPSV